MIHLIKKEILENIRNIKITILLTIMPLAIIFLMGIAMDGLFSGQTFKMENVTIDYMSDNDMLLGGVKEVLEPLLDETSSLVEVVKVDDGIKHVENNDAIGFIEIKGNGIDLHLNEAFGDQGSILKSALDAFTTRVNVVMISGNTEVKLNKVEVLTIDNSGFLSAMDYYGIAMTILFVFYAIPMPTSMVIKEKTEGTLSRVLLTPVNKNQILLGKWIGNYVVSIVQMTIIFLVTWLVFGVEWANPLYSYLIIISFTGLAMGIGVFLGTLFSSEDKAMALIHTLIAVMAFFGGSYMPLSDVGFLATAGKYFSPIWWNMNALLSLVYNSDASRILPTIIFNVSIALVLVLFASILLKKEKRYA